MSKLKIMGPITFDTQSIDFIEGLSSSVHVFGSDEDMDYHLECDIYNDKICIDSGHSIDNESVINNNLNFELLEMELNNQIAINKYSND